jgi:hypothetical protein
VIETHLEDMSPVLALIIEPFVHHLHDLHKVVPEEISTEKVVLSVELTDCT